MDSRCKQAVLEVIATIETEISAKEEEINEHVNNYSHLKNMVEYIKTIKGIGYLKIKKVEYVKQDQSVFVKLFICQL